MPIIDYVFRVHGDCIRAGYAYPMYAALKLNDLNLATDSRVFLGPLEGVRHFGKGYLAIREETYWRARGPSDVKDNMHRLCGRKLLIGDHVVRLGTLRIEALVPSSAMHAEFVAIKSQHFADGDRHPSHQEFLGLITDKLRRKFGIAHGKVEIGRRKLLHIGEHPASTGYAIGIYGIAPDLGLVIQREGLGGRRHMGATLFKPGMLPSWSRSERKCFNIAPERPRTAI